LQESVKRLFLADARDVLESRKYIAEAAKMLAYPPVANTPGSVGYFFSKEERNSFHFGWASDPSADQHGY